MNSPVGRVISPKGHEATLDSFTFWAAPESWVEKTELVVVDCAYPDGQVASFYAVVDDAGYLEISDSVHQDRLRRETPGAEAPGGIDGGTAYYRAVVLRTKPDAFIPPIAGSVVRRATAAEAAYAYGFDEVRVGIPVGLLRNGARRTLGPAMVDLSYLLGENGAHLSVTGISGVATKTSSLLVAIMSVLQTAARLRREAPSSADKITPCPVLFSVKGTDMLWIDRPSSTFRLRGEERAWREMGLEPRPFRNVRMLVPAVPGRPTEPQHIVPRADLEAYSWGLGDIIEQGLFGNLFPADLANQNFGHLVGIWQTRLTRDSDGRRTLAPRESGMHYCDDGTPQTFAELVRFLAEELRNTDAGGRQDTSHRMEQAHFATVRAFYRRLVRLRETHHGVIAWDQPRGRPIKVRLDNGKGLHEGHVIDIASLAGSPDMQRFVIMAVLRQLQNERLHPDAPKGIRYLVVLDELNQWAARGGTDGTTRLFEKIAGEMRSLGVILFGAQQFASQVSRKVVENASCKLVGRCGYAELGDDLFRWLSPADKALVSRLRPGEQVLSMPTFRTSAHVRVPFPAWAMRSEEVDGGASEAIKDLAEQVMTNPSGLAVDGGAYPSSFDEILREAP